MDMDTFKSLFIPHLLHIRQPTKEELVEMEAQGYDRNTHVEVHLDMIKGHTNLVGHSVFDKNTFSQPRKEEQTVDELKPGLGQSEKSTSMRRPELRKGVESYRCGLFFYLCGVI